MENIFTKNQMLLIRYLAVTGCSGIEGLYIMTRLGTGKAVIEMLEFCRDNLNASREELIEASSKIYLKYKDEIEADDEANEEMYRAEMEKYREYEETTEL